MISNSSKLRAISFRNVPFLYILTDVLLSGLAPSENAETFITQIVKVNTLDSLSCEGKLGYTYK